MATTFNVFYLGQLPLLDPSEGNQLVDESAVNAWLDDYGSESNPLFDNIKEFSPGDGGFGGGESTAYDLDNNVSSDTFRIDGGPEQTHDATMVFNATLTYKDGSTADITAVVFQDENGNAYLAPEVTENADQAALEAAPVRSISLNSPIYGENNTGQGHSLFGDRVAADYICFASHTRLQCAKGARKIGDLKPGDLVKTLDGSLAAIRWAGGRRVSVPMQVAFPWLRPVCISAGALGQGLPLRDLIVSPQHRVLLRSRIVRRMVGADDCLTPVRHLVGFPGIAISSKITEIHYRHILLDHHDVVLAEGAPAESLWPGPQAMRTMSADARREILTLLPELEFSGEPLRVARPILSRKRTRRLVRRHLKNHQPLLAG